MRRSQRLLRNMLLLVVLFLVTIARAADYGQELEKQYGLYPDFAANLRLLNIARRLSYAAELPQSNFKIFNNKELNAMALPDGRIYVTSAMATVTTDDELAFVLGHELTHIKEKHAQHQSTRATGGALLGAIIVAAIGGSEADIRTGADIIGGLTFGHYSRKDERRADEGGVRLMARAGYDPKRAADAMQRLIDKYGDGDADTPILGWFASHPDTDTRKARVTEMAGKLEKKPEALLPAPLGVEVTLDPSAEHARAWLPDYFAMAVTEYSRGRGVLLAPPVAAKVVETPPAPVTNTPPAPVAQTAEAAKDEKKTKDGKKAEEEKDAPLPPVQVRVPAVPTAFRVTVCIQPIPVGGMTDQKPADGTAVAITLKWTEVASGFTGSCTAHAQTRKEIKWMAQEELTEPADLLKLEDGRKLNIEGTLEATALRRVTRAFGEYLEAGGPVDHSAPVTLRLSSTSTVRPGDYVGVYRKGQMVAEVLVEKSADKNVTGTVLWGSHTWKKGDVFIPEP